MTEILTDVVPIDEIARILISKRDKFFWEPDDEEAPSDDWLFDAHLESLNRAVENGILFTRDWDRAEMREPLISRWIMAQKRHAFEYSGFPDLNTLQGRRFFDKVDVHEALFVRVATHVLFLAGIFMKDVKR